MGLGQDPIADHVIAERGIGENPPQDLKPIHLRKSTRAKEAKF